jgi:predicted class III extradiol MEMO1 family dioxygenase
MNDELNKKNDALSRLIGARLTSVQFVLDYLILGFDERGAMTTLVWPELYAGRKKTVLGMQEYRNELCSLIEKTTKSVTISFNETISVKFENSTEMRIPLQSYKGSGERVVLTGPNHYLFVF